MLVVSRSLASSRLGLNLIAEEEQETEANVEWKYAVGFRRPIGASVDWGVEALGELEEDAHEALFGLYFEPRERLTVNVGVGTGFGDNEADFTFRTVLVWRATK